MFQSLFQICLVEHKFLPAHDTAMSGRVISVWRPADRVQLDQTFVGCYKSRLILGMVRQYFDLTPQPFQRRQSPLEIHLVPYRIFPVYRRQMP